MDHNIHTPKNLEARKFRIVDVILGEIFNLTSHELTQSPPCKCIPGTHFSDLVAASRQLGTDEC